jgi:hypothetical protein
VVVAFRGTDTFSDIAIDALGGKIDIFTGRILFPFSRWKAGDYNVFAHRNFLTTYQGLQDSVRKLVTELFDGLATRDELYVTGHSLGGALATLCALDLATALKSDPNVPKPRLWTFAAPFVGDAQLYEALDHEMYEQFRVINPNDWVPGVPNRGWTPDWMDWFNGGKIGPEPSPKFADYVQTGQAIATTRPDTLLAAHLLATYYLGCQELQRIPSTGGLKPTDQIQSLLVTITTANVLGGGTDCSVFVRLLDVEWGPLDHPGNDFEAGSTDTYDLFADFPAKVPPRRNVSDLSSIELRLADCPFYEPSWYVWRPERIVITINGVKYTDFPIGVWLGGADASRKFLFPITPPS